MPRGDGLDELNDTDLRDLAMEFEVNNVPYLRQDGTLPPGERERLIQVLRFDKGAFSPYVRKNFRRASDQAMVEEPDPAMFEEPWTEDKQEQFEIQETIDAYYDDDPNPAGRVGMYRVTLRSGNQIVVYATPEAVDDIAMDHTIVRVDDNDVITFPATSTKYTEEELYRKPTQPSTHATSTRQGRPRRARLPDRRIGKHQAGDVVDLGEQRRKPARGGEPILPFGYESKEPVTRLPRHRRKQP